jgi:hypothetical protein
MGMQPDQAQVRGPLDRILVSSAFSDGERAHVDSLEGVLRPAPPSPA